jgi:hypothetical protein
VTLPLTVSDALLLFVSRDAIRTGVHTPLSRATAFLWADYDRSAYLWEPLEMCRKLTLTGERASPMFCRLLYSSHPGICLGWVLLIGDDSEQARLLVALLFSIVFLSTHMSLKPMLRYAALLCTRRRSIVKNCDSRTAGLKTASS